jgi:hypothetical protein
MISIPSFAPSASKPHDKAAKREQNPHYTRYNGLSLTLADLGGVCESILHAAPDMDWNFYTVSARP